jgi:hypothetical protein
MSTSYNSNRIKQFQDIVKNRDGKTYFDLQDERRKNDPDAYNARAKVATEGGKSACKAFLDRVADYNSEGHEAAYKRFVSEFGSDPKKAEKSFIADTMKLCDAYDYIPRNQSYEQNMMENRTITKDGKTVRQPLAIHTVTDSAIISKYRALLSAMWASQGYSGDAQETENFWNSHSLSTDAPADKESARDSILSNSNSAIAAMNRL